MTVVMGVLNVTPDSFSDGGLWLDPEAAVAHAREMANEGAGIIDVGGESTRPGATAVPADEELRRVVPVVEALAGQLTVSIDTRKETVARAAVAAGASVINDVSGTLWRVAAETGAGWVAGHLPAEPSVMQRHAVYADVVSEVRDDLVAKAERAKAAGVSQIWIDPGIGFGKLPAHNLSILLHLDALVSTGWPVAVGTSRKSFLGVLAPLADGTPAPADDRLEASVATTLWAALLGAEIVRVHDVGPVVEALRLADKVAGGEAGEAAGDPAGAGLGSPPFGGGRGWGPGRGGEAAGDPA